MILFNKAFMKIWKVEKMDKYTKATATTGDKQADGTYKNSNWNIRLVGKAKDIAVEEGDSIEITSAKIENIWDKDKQRNWLNVIVFDFKNNTGPGANSDDGFYPVDDEEGDMPF